MPPLSTDYERFDERELVEAARRDANAFAVLYRRYVDRIHGFAYRRTSSVEAADDITAATFEKALRGLAGFRWREPGIGPWLFRIASNELVDTYRREGRQSQVAASVAQSLHTSPTVDLGAASDDRAEVLQALDRISPRYQRALTLRYLADLSNEDAAQAMGVSRATMAVLVHRAGAALRKVIEEQRGEVIAHGR